MAQVGDGGGRPFAAGCARQSENSRVHQRVSRLRIFRLTRVTRIFQKSIFTEIAPEARAGLPRRVFCCAAASAAVRGAFASCEQEKMSCSSKKAKAEIQPDVRAGRAIGRPGSCRACWRKAPSRSAAG